MARTCDICGKGVQHGQNVSHAHNVTKRRWEVNLQTVHALVSGKPKRAAPPTHLGEPPTPTHARRRVARGGYTRCSDRAERVVAPLTRSRFQR